LAEIRRGTGTGKTELLSANPDRATVPVGERAAELLAPWSVRPRGVASRP